MSDLRDLYQEVILDHSKRPRNFRKMESANRHAEGYNPLCGDKVTVYLAVRDGIVVDAAFQGSGCAISTASASMMTESLKGKTVAEVEAMFSSFHQMMTAPEEPEGVPTGLGKLAIFAGVREFPMRVKCAVLAWHTLRSALADNGEAVTE